MKQYISRGGAKRIFSVLLCLTLILGILTPQTFAVTDENASETPQNQPTAFQEEAPAEAAEPAEAEPVEAVTPVDTVQPEKLISALPDADKTPAEPKEAQDVSTPDSSAPVIGDVTSAGQTSPLDLELTINDGDATSNSVPVYGLWADAYQESQFVIHAADLASVLGSKWTNMRFYASSPATEAWGVNFQVYIGPYDADSINEFVDYSQHTLVYEGVLDGTGETMDVEFSNPYIYNSGNMLVTFKSTNTGTWKRIAWAGKSFTDTYVSINGHNSSPETMMSVSRNSFAPKITISYTPLDHEHSFTYSAEGATITATCGGEDCYLTDGKVSLTIHAPTLPRQGSSSGSPAATLTGLGIFNNATGLTVSEENIRYSGRGDTSYELSAEPPTTAGTYTASITVEGATASADYAIAAPHVHDFTYVASGNTIVATCADGDGGCELPDNGRIVLTLKAPTDLAYNGSAKAATLSGYPDPAPTGLAPQPEIVYYASEGEGSTVAVGSALSGAPSAKGDYVAKITWGSATASAAFTISDMVQIGDEASTKTQYYFPIDMYYNYSLTQQIFKRDEMNGLPCRITSISFEYAYTQPFSMDGIKIWLLETDKDVFESGTDFVPLTDATLVYEGSLAASGAGWITLKLDQPFRYTGTGNLLLCCYDPTYGYPGSSYVFRATETPTDLGIYYHSDGNCPDPDNIDVSGNMLKYRSNVRFTYSTEGMDHQHSFTYSADGATITATCGAADCWLTDNKATLTLTEPAFAKSGSAGSAEAGLAGLTAFNAATGLTVSTANILYSGRGNTNYPESATAPTAKGTYTAKLTVEGATATLDYEIPDFVPYTFYLADTYGDGWNGTQVLVHTADGVTVATVTLSAGYSATVEVPLAAGVSYQLVLGNASYLYEASFSMYDDVNTLVFATSEATGSSSSGGGLADYTKGDVIYSFTVPAICENHDMEFVSVGKPTCTTPGYTTSFYRCRICGRCYLDEAGKQRKSLDELISAPALGHDWGTPVYVENDTHRYTCSRCGVTKEESCSITVLCENGLNQRLCTLCGNSETSAPNPFMLTGWYFETDDELDGWTVDDADGDGNQWGWYKQDPEYAYEGGRFLGSNGRNGAQDNWAFTPAFDLSHCETASVSLWIARYSSSYDDKFEIWAGTSNNKNDMVQVQELTTPTGADYNNYVIDLSAYSGQSKVYVAIRHKTTAATQYLFLDQVEVFGTNSCTNHTMKLTEAKAPTCTEPGIAVDYYQCENCGRTYLDAAGTQPVLLSDVVLPAPGHEWGEPVYCENNQHRYTCTRCSATEDEACTNVTTLENAVEKQYCSVCGHVVSEVTGDIKETLTGWGFETDPETDGWQYLDADGDSYTWQWNLAEDNSGNQPYSSFTCYEGNGCLTSASYINNVGELTPDNWAISPAFSLTDSEITGAEVTFWAAGQDSDYPDEKFTVYAGTTADPTSMTALVEDDFTATGEYQKYTAMLTQDLIGQSTVYIAIVHHNCTDNYWLNIDNVEIVTTLVDHCANSKDHTLENISVVGENTYKHCTVCGRYFCNDQQHPIQRREVLFPITVDQNIAHGTVTVAPSAHEDETVVVTVTPEDGYRFVTDSLTYTVEGKKPVVITPTDGVYSFEMPFAAVNLTARFDWIYFTGHTLTLNGDVGVNFFVDLVGYDKQNAKVVLSWGEGDRAGTETIELKDLTAEDNGYRITANVPACQMTDIITAKLYVGDTLIEENTYSVAEYARYVLSASDLELAPLVGNIADRIPLLRNLCEAMLYYGGRAQVQFNYRTDDLADDGLLPAMLDEPEGLGSNVFPEDLESVCGIRYYGSKLLLESSLVYRLYFTISGQDKLDVLTVTMNDQELQRGTSGSYVYFDVPSLAPAELLSAHTVHFGSLAATVNAGNYINKAIENGRGALPYTVTALYYYSRAASAYFG